MSDAMPLGAAASSHPACTIAQQAPLGQITLRGALDDPGFREAVEGVLGHALPGVRAVVFEGGRGAVWMSPDELLLFTEPAETGATLERLGAALEGVHHLALDVSDARVVLRLEGAGAAEVLAKSVPVDLSEAAFPIGAARRSHLGGIAVAFWRREATAFEVVAFRSVAHHLLGWLETSIKGGRVGWY
ncbi:MAG: sarcosine oxidase subunit gamma family protein [Pseudomonadota bacterium]